MGFFSKKRDEKLRDQFAEEQVEHTDVHALAATQELPEQSEEAQSDLDVFLGGFDELDEVQGDFEAALTRFRSRTRMMGEFSKGMRRDAARGAQALVQVHEFQIENTKLRALNDEQIRKLGDVEASYDSALATNENLRNEIEGVNRLNSELEADREKLEAVVTKLRAQGDRNSAELRDKSDLLSRQNHEIETLRAAKSDLNSALRANMKELDEAQYRLTGLQAKYEKAAAFQNAAVSDREKFMEERRVLRREIGTLETKLDDASLKLDRLAADKKDLIGRIATEKFSTGKQHDSLLSELGILKEQYAFAESEVKRLSEQLTQERAERKAAELALNANNASLEDGRRNLTRANLSISEMNLKYASDRAALDQLTDENQELKAQNKSLQRELHEMSDYRMQAHAAKVRADKLEERLSELMDGLNSSDNGTSNAKSAKVHAKIKVAEDEALDEEAANAMKH